MAMIFISGMLA